MGLLRLLLNILWFVLGGVLMGLGWWLAGAIMFITIIGAPWGAACFRIGTFSFFPFGKEISRRSEGLGTGPLGFLGNVIWFLLAGWWLAIGHIASALANAVTIIGLPFALQHLKLAMLTLAPIGAEVRDLDD